MKHKITRSKTMKFTPGETADLVAIIFVTAVILLGIISGYALTLDAFPKVLYLCFVTALLAWGLYMKRQKRKGPDDYHSEIMDSISDEELEELNFQLTKDNYYYKTFYLTERYICFPNEFNKLIPYDHIEDISAEYKRYSRYEQGIYMFLTLKDGRKLQFFINQNYKFSKEKYLFLIELKEILKNSSTKMAASQLTDDRFYYKTYYLTDTMLFVPHKGLMIDYDQMQAVYAHSHSLRGIPRWHIHITDKEGCDYYFDVKQYFKFVRNVDDAVYHIRSMFDERVKEHIEKFSGMKG